MKYIGRNLRALLAMTVIATLAAMSIPQPRPLAAAGSAPVMVTNTPLPVSISGSPTITLAPGSLMTLPTHLGIQPSSMVALTCNIPAGNICVEFIQLAPDGSGLPTNAPTFSIPPGMDLVITDATWVAQGGVPGNTAMFNVLATSGFQYHVSTALINTDALAGANETYTTGFRVSTMPRFGVLPNIFSLDLRGYLVPHQ